MEIKDWHTVVRDRKEGTRTVLEAKVRNGMQWWRRKRKTLNDVF